MDSSWNQERNELACSFRLVGNDPLTAVIHVPSPYLLAAVKADGAAVEAQAGDRVALVTLRLSTSGEAKAVITFTR